MFGGLCRILVAGLSQTVLYCLTHLLSPSTGFVPVCLVPLCGFALCNEVKFLVHSRCLLPICFPPKVVDEQMEVSGRHRAAQDMFDVILCKVEPLLELPGFVEVEHGACNGSCYLLVERFDVQARNMRDLCAADCPSLLVYISHLQALRECLDESQIQCTAFASQSGVCIQSFRAVRHHG